MAGVSVHYYESLERTDYNFDSHNIWFLIKSLNNIDSQNKFTKPLLCFYTSTNQQP